MHGERLGKLPAAGAVRSGFMDHRHDRARTGGMPRAQEQPRPVLRFDELLDS
jgi:hypothetical protein